MPVEPQLHVTTRGLAGSLPCTPSPSPFPNARSWSLDHQGERDQLLPLQVQAEKALCAQLGGQALTFLGSTAATVLCGMSVGLGF